MLCVSIEKGEKARKQNEKTKEEHTKHKRAPPRRYTRIVKTDGGLHVGCGVRLGGEGQKSRGRWFHASFAMTRQPHSRENRENSAHSPRRRPDGPIVNRNTRETVRIFFCDGFHELTMKVPINDDGAFRFSYPSRPVIDVCFGKI